MPGFTPTNSTSVRVPAPAEGGRCLWVLAAAIGAALGVGLAGCGGTPPSAAPPNREPAGAGALRFVVRPRAERPLVMFAFPPPLEDYRGEAAEITGELSLGETIEAATLSGFIEARTASVTLGDPDIDANAHSAMFLNVERYPVSRFSITSIEDTGESSALGDGPVRVRMLGEFSMRGHTVPIAVPTTLTARRGADGGIGTIALEAAWEINILNPFEIPGPGPGESGERVVFRATLELEKAK